MFNGKMTTKPTINKYETFIQSFILHCKIKECTNPLKVKKATGSVDKMSIFDLITTIKKINKMVCLMYTELILNEMRILNE